MLSESYNQTILTYSELISNRVFLVFLLSQSYYQTAVNTFLKVSMGTKTERKFSRVKIPN